MATYIIAGRPNSELTSQVNKKYNLFTLMYLFYFELK